MAILTTPEQAAEALRRYRRVAVLGASVHRDKPAHYVPRYLDGAGYEIFPVNPTHAGAELFGRTVVAALSGLDGTDPPVEVVDVFRRPEHLPDHLPEILAMDPRPRLVWFQQGIRHDEVARELSDAGIDVIQDRCMLADHQRLL